MRVSLRLCRMLRKIRFGHSRYGASPRQCQQLSAARKFPPQTIKSAGAFGGRLRRCGGGAFLGRPPRQEVSHLGARVLELESPIQSSARSDICLSGVLHRSLSQCIFSTTTVPVCWSETCEFAQRTRASELRDNKEKLEFYASFRALRAENEIACKR